VHQVNEAIAQAAASLVVDVLEPVVGADRIAARREGDLDEVHESPAEDLRFGTVRATADQSAALALQQGAIFALQFVAIRAAHRHIQQAVRSKRQPMQAAVVRVAKAAEDDYAPIGTPFAFGVFEGHKVGWVSDIELAIAPHEAHRKVEAIREDARLPK